MLPQYHDSPVNGGGFFISEIEENSKNALIHLNQHA
jgi:hypothetical protein